MATKKTVLGYMFKTKHQNQIEALYKYITYNQCFLDPTIELTNKDIQKHKTLGYIPKTQKVKIFKVILEEV